MIFYLAFNIFTNWTPVGEFEGKQVEIGKEITQESLKICLDDGTTRLVLKQRTNEQNLVRYVDKSTDRIWLTNDLNMGKIWVNQNITNYNIRVWSNSISRKYLPTP
jgi:hypothetical protein